MSLGEAARGVDVARLERDLRGHLRCEVGFDPGQRALYALDGSIYRQVPLGVVVPRRTEDIVRAVEVCRHHGAPIFMRGGGTGLAGQTCNTAVVLDISRYCNRLQKLDIRHEQAFVEPGLVLDDLRESAEHHHLTFAPDPATHARCTLGGMIGNNACGAHSVMGGKTVDNVEELDILTYGGLRLRVGATSEKELARIIAAGGRKGEIYAGLKTIRDRYGDLVRARYPKIPRRVSGYNLDQLLPENGFHVARALVGSESTCAIVLGAKLRLMPSPAARALLVLAYPDVYAAGDDVCRLLEHHPIALEGFDDLLPRYYRGRHEQKPGLALLPDGGGWLLAEFGADTIEAATAQAQAAMAAIRLRPNPPEMRLAATPEQAQSVWKIREGGVGATSYTPEGKVAWPGWEDSAVPPEKLGDYLRQLRALLNRFHYGGSVFGHFGQACLHLRIDFNLRTADGIATFRRFMEEAADLVVGFGGSLSGEHGDGQVRAELLPRMLGEDLVEGLEAFKAVWDPDWKMNPGKMVRPYPLDAGLRLGASYRPAQPETRFQFPQDKGSFSAATLRCSGIGLCRRHDHDFMCPSYMVTREEKHSTRGRAHLLWEMLQGDLVQGGWRSQPVHEALDLCLSCKGCKSDCPVNVDIATYKAEFLSHYYEGRLRPPHAYALGLVRTWSELASRAPGLANFVSRTPPLSLAAKLAAGISQHRRVPGFAPEAFTQWFARRQPDAEARASQQQRGAKRVLLFPDTFNNFFHPEVAKAAVEVLEAAGCNIALPQRPLCCGRPLYDYGFLDQARRRLRHAIEGLRDEISDGIPMLVLEPSCAAVFRDELVNLFPHDEDARRLSRQTVTLPEFLSDLDGYQPPRFRSPRQALLQVHCHQHALLRPETEKSLLEQMGIECEQLDAGCCGMAGSFGFEKRHYAVSAAVGERKLLPQVRQAPSRTLIVADGFSCREQIGQMSPRRGLHLAQVIALAQREAVAGSPSGVLARPERAFPQPAASRKPYLLAAAALVGLGAIWLSRRLGVQARTVRTRAITSRQA